MIYCRVLGRILALIAGLALVLAPFLTFAEVPLLSMQLQVPGICFRGGLVSALGALLLWYVWQGEYRPWLPLSAALAAGWLLALDYELISVRTPYWLGRLQLMFIPVNDLLIKIGREPWEFRCADPQAIFTGYGFKVGYAASFLAALASLAEAVGFKALYKTNNTSVQPSWPAVMVWPGLWKCKCGHKLSGNDHYCSHCGSLCTWEQLCANCGYPLQEGRFCWHCGAEVEFGSSRAEARQEND